MAIRIFCLIISTLAYVFFGLFFSERDYLVKQSMRCLHRVHPI